MLLPAYYDKNRAYPVLYLLHGYYDDESWMKNTTRLLYLGRASEDQAVGDTPAQIHGILERNSVEHIWQLFDSVGHDKNSVEVYLYNYLRMIFK